MFGQGLGPASGVQPQINLTTGFPDQLPGVQLTFNGAPAPLLYVSDGQINAIAPWSLEDAGTVEICASYAGSRASCIEREVVAANPGVFTTDGVHAAALNQDGTINSASNPAKFGTIVSAFATGLGPIDPPRKDGGIVGLPLPSNRVPFLA